MIRDRFRPKILVSLDLVYFLLVFFQAFSRSQRVLENLKERTFRERSDSDRSFDFEVKFGGIFLHVKLK